jgi:hypothetical protein
MILLPGPLRSIFVDQLPHGYQKGSLCTSGPSFSPHAPEAPLAWELLGQRFSIVPFLGAGCTPDDEPPPVLELPETGGAGIGTTTSPFTLPFPCDDNAAADSESSNCLSLASPAASIAWM